MVLPEDTFFCYGTSIELDAGNPGANYLWNTQKKSQKIIVNNAGVYTVQIYTDSCNNSDTVLVIEKALPTPDLGKDTTVCLNEKFWLDAGTYTFYEWQPRGENSQKIEIFESGLYSVKVWDKNNCYNSDTIKITNHCEIKLFIPNAFSPNDDGLNEIFKVVATEIADFELLIYNRWGEKLFESNDQNKGWNGKYKNKSYPIGVYYYQIKYKTESGETKNVFGLLHLVR